jgi:hypothetical protein
MTVELDNLVVRDADGVVAVSSALLCALYLPTISTLPGQVIGDVIQSYVDHAKEGLRCLMPSGDPQSTIARSEVRARTRPPRRRKTAPSRK